jgi:Tol biopolymer transport system component
VRRLIIRILFLGLIALASADGPLFSPAFETAAMRPCGHAAEESLLSQTGARAPIRLDYPLVITEVPVRNRPAGLLPEGVLQLDASRVGRIVIHQLNGSRLNLTAGFSSACDPEVSFDGRHILFAGKKSEADNWNIYEIGSDGSGVRQVTRGLGDCRNPVYLSTLYTLISDKPWHQIAFTSNMARTAGEYGLQPVSSVYSSRIDGTGLMRLTHGPSGDSDPFQMLDGRLLFSGWRPRLPGSAARMPLFAVNIDGTDLLLFSDSEGRRYKRMPCATTERLAVFVESEQLRQDGAGNLACVNLRRNLHSYRQLTKPGEGLFRCPAPLPDGRVLVSRRPGDGKGTFGIYVFDPDSGGVNLVLDDPKLDETQARILAARPEPDGRSTSVLRRTGEIEDPHALEPRDKKDVPRELPSGRLYCLNVYSSHFASRTPLPSGTVKRVRVLEGILPSATMNPPADGTGFKARSAGISDPPVLKRRFVGEAPVEEDGSFNLHVPANIPIELQILDSDGLALASCSWIWVKNNEPRGCIGCHEDPELVPENHLVAAVAKPSLELVLPPDRRRSVDFLHKIVPIIRAKCISCHQAGQTEPWLGGDSQQARATVRGNSRRVYESLLGDGHGGSFGSSWVGKYVAPGRARTSRLIWHIFGRNTSRPWDPPSPSAAFKAMPSASGAILSEEERRTFAEWIDTGAHWDCRSAQDPVPQKGSTGGVRKP